jgi:glycerophosphoryl diester phosphodiesterase
MELDWLTDRPIAHRGLHDSSRGIIENSISAFHAAVAGNYAIECDVQVTRDGEAMVHHDAVLGRLTPGRGRLAQMSADELKQVPFLATGDRMLTLRELCDLVDGRVPLVIEIKSEFDGDQRLASRVATVLREYHGPAAAMSFDPEVVTMLGSFASWLPRGIVAERHYRHREWADLTWFQRQGMAHLLHFPTSRPSFVAYSVKDLPTMATRIARKLFGRPLLAWTVRTEEDRARAERYAAQMIFEGFRP